MLTAGKAASARRRKQKWSSGRADATVSPIAQHSLLASLLHPDVIPIVLGYSSTIAFGWVQTWGTKGIGDGELKCPRALALRGRDELFVCDVLNHRIQVFHHATGRFLRKWGEHGSNPGQLRYPVAIHVEDDNLIVFDKPLKENIMVTRLQMFSSSDSSYMYQINLPKSYQSPSGILVDSTHSRYYIPATDGSDNINIFTAAKDSTPLILQGCLSDQEKTIGSIRHMVIQEAQLFAVDWLFNAIHVFDLVSGSKVRTFGRYGKLASPEGLVVYGEQIIVASTGQDRLVVFDRNTYGLNRDFKGGSPPFLAKPAGLLINPFTNQLLVCDAGNHRIVVLE